jgi:hypothetical protein
MLFDCAAEQPDFTHAWFPHSAFDVVSIEEDMAIARGGNGMALLKGSGRLQPVMTGPTAGNELRLRGRKASWLARLGDTARDGEPGRFAERFAGLAVREAADGSLEIDDPEYGPVIFHSDGRVEAEGRTVDPATWTVEGNAGRLLLRPL